jgi:GxxExxY protein
MGCASLARVDHDYDVTSRVIGCAIEVHKALGPGLKEKSYSAALCESLSRQGIEFDCERTVPLRFAGVHIGSHRPDLIVENTVVVEVKSVEKLHPLFTSQLVTYLKVTGLRVGLILNFNCARMKDGIKRVVC